MNYWCFPGVKRVVRDVEMHEIVKALMEWHGVEKAYVVESPSHRAVEMRYIVYYLMEKYGKMSQTRIASYFGQRRENVVFGKQKIEKAMDWDGEVRDCVEWIEFRLFGVGKQDAFKAMQGR